MSRYAIWSARAGAVSYAVWALLHFQAAWSVYTLGLTMAPSMQQARVLQDAWNLGCFSIAALGVALLLNWRNSLLGFWLNLAIVSVADLGFLFFVLVPGHLGFWPGILGPLFWIAGAVLSGLAILPRSTVAERAV